MPKPFEIPTTHGDTYIVQPYAVAYGRPRELRRAVHDPRCFSGNVECHVQHPSNSDLPGAFDCGYADPEAVVEVCFLNTIGPESSVMTTLSLKQFHDALSEAMRYNL